MSDGACGARPTDADDPVPVAGLVRFSTVDWPGRLAAVVFLQGCPWRCTYCHNPALLDPRAPAALRWGEVVAFLRARVGLLDGVVLSGGEPTLHAGLGDAMREVRALGFGVGLHTGGAWPARLERVLPLVDWVGLDVKHLPGRYPDVTGAGPSGRAAWASLEAVLASGVEVEVRTTVDPTVHTRDDVVALASRLAALGAPAPVLQEARATGARPGYAQRLAGRRITDVLRANDLPGLFRR